MYNAHTTYTVRVELNTGTRFYSVSVNGKQVGRNLFFAPVESVERILFRTGDTRRFPDADTPTDQMYDLKNPGAKAPLAAFYIESFKTSVP